MKCVWMYVPKYLENYCMQSMKTNSDVSIMSFTLDFLIGGFINEISSVNLCN